MHTGMSVIHTYHWLTCPKGVHQFRYFLPQCVHQIILLTAHAYMHFNLRQNTYMNDQTTIGFAQRKYLNQCMPFGYVSQWYSVHVHGHLPLPFKVEQDCPAPQERVQFSPLEDTQIHSVHTPCQSQLLRQSLQKMQGSEGSLLWEVVPCRQEGMIRGQ